MKIVKTLNRIPRFFKSAEPTIHFHDERNDRLQAYIKAHGKGRPIKAFVVDRNHPNGNEVHVICDNRLVYVFNSRTERLVTVLYVRPKQLSRYGTAWLKLQVHPYQEGWNTI